MTTSSRKGHGMEDCICVEDAFCEGDCPAMDCNQESKGTPMTEPPLTDAELDAIEATVLAADKHDQQCRCDANMCISTTGASNQTIFELIAELRALRERDADWTEREAAICPEDRGFEEVITSLRGENAALRTATDEAQAAWASTAAVNEKLHEQLQELLDIRDVRVAMATIHRLTEQNAALVAALERLGDEAERSTPSLPTSLRLAIEDASDVLARVRGAE